MLVADLFNLPSLKAARLVAGEEGLSNRIAHVNIIEAPDIAQWLSPGTVLLSSYYGVSNLDRLQLETFFKEIHHAKAAAIILKTHRFIDSPPAHFVELCELHGIALLCIQESIRYENIIMDIMMPMISLKASLLDKHYRMNAELSQMRMKELGLEETLSLLSSVLGSDLTLLLNPSGNVLSTKKDDADEIVMKSISSSSSNLEGFSYVKQECWSSLKRKMTHRALVAIPLSARTECKLIVHCNDELDDEHLVLLESIMRYLQVELLNRRNMDSIIYINKNNLVEELLSNKGLSARALSSILSTLDLDSSERYQVAQISMLAEETDAQGSAWNVKTNRLGLRIAQEIEKRYRHCAYHVTQSRIAIIINIENEENPLEESMLASMIPDDHPRYVAGISEVGVVDRLNELMNQTQQIKDVQKMLGRFGRPCSYRNLGVLKLLSTQESREAILSLVPERIKTLHEQHPSLFQTAVSYIEHGQNAQKTAESLAVHPKTVDYRIGKVKKLQLFDIGDADDVLQLLFAAKILGDPS